MTVLVSPFRLARRSAIISGQHSEAESLALNADRFAMIVDPAEAATEYAALALYDRAGGTLLHARGATLPSLATLGSRPVVQGNDNGGHLRAAWQLPQSYFMAAAFRTGTDFATTNAIISSATQNDNRLLFGTIGTSLVILHGPNFPLASTTPMATNTDYVAWASFDADTMAAEIGVNAVTPHAVGTLPVLHKGDPETSFFGGIGGWGFDAKFAPAVVVPRFLGGAINAARRAAILAWLGETVGVGIGA